ncbi:hypothetical protein [Streptomyces sp. NPDC051567]|uniref:AraC-like ligand-binding domain-containing protein n=1 Tax=Streptomyces sp. NPDC051567 TaxID=3365660 RepID=UPI0037B06187
MIETVFRSEDVPAADRFECWRELVQRASSPVELDSEYRDDFRVSQRLLEFGGVTVWPCRFQPVRFLRTPKLVRQSDPERVNVSLPTLGTLNVTRDDREAVYDPFSFCVIDSSRTVDVRAGGPHEGIGFDVPRALLPLPADAVSQLSGYRLSAREGIGALLADFLVRLSTDTGSFRRSDGPRLAVVAVDLASALFASAPCGKWGPDRDGRAWEKTVKTSANQRTGSSTGCASNGMAYPSHTLDYHCYTWGNDGKSWTFVTNVTVDKTTGWIRDDLLKDGGSNKYCGF